MINLHAQIIRKNGKNEFVVLPYDEFLQIQEQLENYEDLRALREAKEAEKDAPTVGIEEFKKLLKAQPDDEE